MKVTSVVSCGALAASVSGQNGNAFFEGPDFNVTEALIDVGFNVSAIPELADLVDHLSLTACSVAVILPYSAILTREAHDHCSALH